MQHEWICTDKITELLHFAFDQQMQRLKTHNTQPPQLLLSQLINYKFRNYTVITSRLQIWDCWYRVGVQHQQCFHQSPVNSVSRLFKRSQAHFIVDFTLYWNFDWFAMRTLRMKFVHGRKPRRKYLSASYTPLFKNMKEEDHILRWGFYGLELDVKLIWKLRFTRENCVYANIWRSRGRDTWS